MIGLDVDEYLLPSERRVPRVRLHRALLARDIVESTVALVLLIALQG